MSENIDPLLSRAEASLVALQDPDASDPRSLALQFGDDIGDIGRTLTLHPEVHSKVQAFVERTAPVVARDTSLFLWIHRVYDAADSRSSETHEYMRALRMRSTLEFFRDLYRGTVASPAVLNIETEATDRDLEEWGGMQYLEEIPDGYPASHVWWHQSLPGR